MAPFRGRGSSRGRGRGGRKTRGGRKRGFATGTVEEQGANGHSASSIASDRESNSDSPAELSSSGEGEAHLTSNAFHSLLQSFQHSATAKDKPRRKRRKLGHAPALADEVDNVENELDDADDAEIADIGAEEEATPQPDAGEDDEEEVDRSDPFEVHFADPDENEMLKRLKAITEHRWTAEKVDVAGGRCVLQVPDVNQKASPRLKMKSARDVNLKPRLLGNAQGVLGQFDAVEQALAPSIFDYQDVLFGARTVRNAGRLRYITCLHALNHIYKTRDRVIKNNGRFARDQDNEDLELRDQGFTRPKVLFLLETKQACVRVVQAMTDLCNFEQQENKTRFLDNFSLPEDKFSDDKPDDFRELFDGNDENEFRIGLKFTRKTLKLFSKFYTSDIILASALGLRRAIETGNSKKKDYDFLSSIEVVVMEQADATLMQNWEHAEYVFSHLNLQPRDAHGCDFSRVRSWYLEGQATNLRQTVILSAYLTPRIMTLYNKYMRNASGRLKFTPDYAIGEIETLNYGIKQTFTRFDSPSHISDPDSRFKYFTSTVLPHVSRLPKPVQGGQGILIFIPSYLDFVRLRNSLVDSDWSYGIVSEYSSPTDVRRARSHFMSGKYSLLLYTGRAHHFHRYNIRGVRHVVFYSVPENPKFYAEAVSWIGRTIERGESGARECGVRVVFSKWERGELERVVGSKRSTLRILKRRPDAASSTRIRLRASNEEPNSLQTIHSEFITLEGENA
ncbi:U3 small nucleolar RNA-associated protein 25 [Lojkania enalia]|uniref:U3 small nucleolar RNA-associated protein 25 n=1 Tax=Lojkania enalia TaxID=147567 RepID=A0A9P4MWE4_9PLEO|nr:U3 small nucleolar RNA-associated protein 25 [Didymosphaeria enalia]